ncbi:MAG: tetratricopeptide repeat protein [Lachnospiraceae bacterium]
MKRFRMTALIFILALSLSGCITNPYKSGVKALENEDYEEAAKSFSEAVEKDKNTADAYRGLGIALWETKDYEGARDALEKALQAGTEKTGTIYNLLGNCELKLGNAKEAAGYFETGLEDKDLSNELRQEMRFNTIVSYEQMGDAETAKSLLEEYISEYPDDEEAAKEAEFLETR